MSRGRDEDRPAVEFVDTRSTAAPDAPGDELSNPRLPRTARWYLALSAAVLVGGALIAAKVSGSGSGGATAPAPSTSAPTTAANAIPGPALDPAQCPGPTPCAATAGVPVTVAAALFDAFPAARLGRASTVYLQAGGLWFREVHARAGLLDILVRVERPDRGAASLQSSRGDDVISIRQLVHGFLVLVQVTGPPDQLPSLPNVNGLAQDIRLLDLS